MEQFNSGEIRIIFRVNFRKFRFGLTIVGASLAAGGKGDISNALVIQDNCLIPALQGIQTQLIDPLSQEMWFFKRILPTYLHIGCAFSLLQSSTLD